MTNGIQGSDSSIYLPTVHRNEKIIYHAQEWPRGMQETTCEKVWRIAYDILSIIIFPIGLCRLLAANYHQRIGLALVPPARVPEKASDGIEEMSNEDFQDLKQHLNEIRELVEQLFSSNQLLVLASGDDQLINFFRELQQVLAVSEGECSIDEMKDMIDRLMASLNALPEPLLSKLFLLFLTNEEDEDISSSENWQENAEAIFQKLDTVFKILISKETLNILRKVILQEPNAFSISMTTPDGVLLDGVHLKNNDRPDAKTLVFCNHFQMPYELFYASMYQLQQGGSYLTDQEGQPFNYLFFNYRGVSQSGSSPDAQGLLIDGYTAVHAVEERFGIPRKNIIVQGREFGGIVANFAAAQHQGIHPDGSDSVSCCNERSAVSLPHYFEQVAEPQIGSCLASIIACCVRMIGWEWDSGKWWRDIKGYKWVVIHPNDDRIPYESSLASAWLSEDDSEEVRQRILQMQDGPEDSPSDAHWRLMNPGELAAQQQHMHRAVQYNHT